MSQAERMVHRFLAKERRLFGRLNRPVTDFIARLPLRLEAKLLIAVLGEVALLITLGVIGLTLSGANARRTEMLISAEQQIDTFRQLEHDGNALLISLSSALWMPGTMINPAANQIEGFEESLADLQTSGSVGEAQIDAVKREYGVFIDRANHELGLLQSGDIDHAGSYQIEQLVPQAAVIEELTDRIVDQAQGEMSGAIGASRDAYRTSRDWLIACIIGASLFGGYLAHTMSGFVVGPLRDIGVRLRHIAEGEFALRVEVSNRDEIGDLAANVNRTSEQLGALYNELEMEKERSEELLYHTLPRPIVQRIRGGEELIADRVAGATILFSDLAGFTQLSDHIAPEEVVDVLDVLFSRYDAIAERLGLEKIKTIGDGYMVAGGVLEPRPDHAEAVAEMALAMRAATDIATRALGVLGQPLRVRIGIHSGPLVAGVLGNIKMVYDVWGDTVNTASRMEKYGEPGRIAVSTATRALLGNQFRFEPRQTIDVKGKGAMETFFLERRIGPLTYHNMVRRMARARDEAGAAEPQSS